MMPNPYHSNYTDYILPDLKARRMSEKTVMAITRPLETRRQYRLREMLDQGCGTSSTGKDFLGTRNSLLWFLLAFPDQRLHIVKNWWTRMYRLHIAYCVEVVYELPLLPNNTAVKHFCTNWERCEVLTGYLSLGRRHGGGWANTWHWTERFKVFFCNRTQ
jgi:hypothetical protein